MPRSSSPPTTRATTKTVERHGRAQRRGRVPRHRIRNRSACPRFVRTDRAGFRHKLYAFAIPFAQLGGGSAKDAGDRKLAFAANGTAAGTWLTPLYQDFGAVPVGTTSSALTVTLTNVYGSDLTLDTPYFTRGGPYSSQFPLTAGTCADGLVVHPSGSCTFHVAFAPTAAGEIGDNIVVAVHSATGAPLTQTLLLNGNGILAIPTFTPVGLAVLALVLSGLGRSSCAAARARRQAPPASDHLRRQAAAFRILSVPSGYASGATALPSLHLAQRRRRGCTPQAATPCLPVSLVLMWGAPAGRAVVGFS